MRRYIKQIDRDNFVYPNNEVSNYDNEIIHEINDKSVIGEINNITFTSLSTSSLVFEVGYTFLRRGAELFKNIGGDYTLVSFHILAPNQIYFKPWKYIGRDTTPQFDIVGQSGTMYFDLIPSDLGLVSFSEGTYTLEVRFIGKRSVYAVCQTFEATFPAPTPTPTPTPTYTPTPTPTSGFTEPTPTPTPTPTLTPSTPVNANVTFNFYNNSNRFGTSIMPAKVDGNYLWTLTSIGPGESRTESWILTPGTHQLWNTVFTTYEGDGQLRIMKNGVQIDIKQYLESNTYLQTTITGSEGDVFDTYLEDMV